MKRNKVIAIVLLVVFGGIILLKTLNQPAPPPKPVTPGGGDSKQVAITPPDFSADSAYNWIQEQVNFGPRVPNTPAHKKCGDWLVSEFTRLGGKVITQEGVVTAWNGTKLNMRNIIVSYNPEAKKRILLAAHWDTRPYGDKDSLESNWKKPIDGANDGGSGVGVLLELARLIKQQPPSVGVDIILFDAEDYGIPEWAESQDEMSDAMSWCLGSQYWSQNLHKPGYQAMYGVLLDMVGGKNARFNREGYSVQAAEDVVNKLWAYASNLGYAEYFRPEVTGEIIDDHLFMNRAGVRSIDVIDMRPSTRTMGFNGYQFGSTHHTHLDNMENISRETLEAVGSSVAYLIYNTH